MYQRMISQMNHNEEVTTAAFASNETHERIGFFVTLYLNRFNFKHRQFRY